jgi:hypothetical protein
MNKFEKKMREEGWPSMQSFFKRSKIPVSMETVRRTLFEGRPTSASMLITVAKHLNFSVPEIKSMLLEDGRFLLPSERPIARMLADMIGEQEGLSDDEAHVISIMRKLKEKAPKEYASMRRLIASAAELIDSVNLKREINILNREE